MEHVTGKQSRKKLCAARYVIFNGLVIGIALFELGAGAVGYAVRERRSRMRRRSYYHSD
jgi:hypothetical protein